MEREREEDDDDEEEREREVKEGSRLFLSYLYFSFYSFPFLHPPSVM